MYGGKPTKSISELFIDNNMPENSILIISGGEVLPARLSNMCWDSENSRIILMIKKAIRKISGIQLYENSLKRKLNIYNNFPWVFGKKDFYNDVKILYNSVGGASLEDLNIQELDNIKNKLKTSDYLSVRDNKTVYNLKEINPRLAPDSATIMSEFFTIDILKDKVSNPIEKFVSKNNGKYICIQSNLDSIKGKEDILVKQLEKIYIKYNYNIVLLPIGIATNHDDDIALKKIKNKLKVPHFLPDNLKYMILCI
jgi:Polysaccharide pyruvyl transferase.